MQESSPVSQSLVFDDESLEGVLYGTSVQAATPANVVEMCRQGRDLSDNTASALASVLACHPELAAQTANLPDAEKLLRRALTATREKTGLESIETAVRLAGLANLLQAMSRLPEAEGLYREALAIQQKALGLAHEDTLRTLDNLASLLEKQEAGKEAATIRIRCAIERLAGKGYESSMLELRAIALELYRAGEYSIAEEIYRRMLERRFQVAGTSCHLARVLVMSGREKDARDALSQGWSRREGALPYVPPRILFFQIAFALLDGRDPGVYLSRLKHLLKQANAQLEWTIGPVINHLRTRLPADTVALLEALAAALSNGQEVAQLDRFPLWRDQKSLDDERS